MSIILAIQICSNPRANVDHSPMVQSISEWPRPPANASRLIISRKTDTDCDTNTDCDTGTRCDTDILIQAVK